MTITYKTRRINHVPEAAKEAVEEFLPRNCEVVVVLTGKHENEYFVVAKDGAARWWGVFCWHMQRRWTVSVDASNTDPAEVLTRMEARFR